MCDRHDPGSRAFADYKNVAIIPRNAARGADIHRLIGDNRSDQQ